MRRGVSAALLSVGGHGVALALLLLIVGEPSPRPTAPRVGFDVEVAALPPPPTPTLTPPPARERERPRAHARPRLAPADSKPAESLPITTTTEPATSPSPSPSISTTTTPSTTTSSSSEGAPPGQTANPESIRAAIAAVIRYPRIARSQGLTGRVVVRFRIAGGRPQEVQIVTSAGAILDGAATDAVNRAAPFDQPDGWVRVPVDFSMQATR